MKRQTKLFLTAGILVALVLASILLLSGGGKREAENLVIMYNQMLTRAHRELRSGLMENVASPHQLSRVDNYLAYLLKSERVLEGELRDIQFVEVNIRGDKAVVVTRERWRYYYVHPVTRQPVSDVYEPLFGNVYTLKKDAGHWVVDDLESNELGGKTEG